MTVTIFTVAPPQAKTLVVPGCAIRRPGEAGHAANDTAATAQADVQAGRSGRGAKAPHCQGA
jgi:hypothetical protein